jgi:aryl-alcohol dehydrogenase-like predicted oxidoreductase
MDCAEAYNNNQAERALGVALKTLGRRHDVVLTSKFGKVRQHMAFWCSLRYSPIT